MSQASHREDEKLQRCCTSVLFALVEHITAQ